MLKDKSINSSKKLKDSDWALLSKDGKKVLVKAKTLKELLRNVEQKGNPIGSISRLAPPNFSSYVG